MDNRHGCLKMVCGGGRPHTGGEKDYQGPVYNNTRHRQRRRYPGRMPRNLELTTNEKKALMLIDRHLKRFNAPPSMRAASRELGLSPSAGAYLLRSMRAKGFVAAGSVKLTAKAKAAL